VNFFNSVKSAAVHSEAIIAFFNIHLADFAIMLCQEEAVYQI